MAQALPDRPTEAYERFFRPGMVLITCRAANGEALFIKRPAAHLVRSVLHTVKAEQSFGMVGFAILPDHLHLLIRPGAGTTAGAIVEALLLAYQRSYTELRGIPGRLEVWDRRRSLERVAGLAQFAETLDRIHYDPVAHGLVARPEAWPESSYSVWVERGLYRLGWGWQKPARLGGG